MNERDLAWRRFAKTGNVGDYINYRQTLEHMAEFAQQEDFSDEIEYGRNSPHTNESGRDGYGDMRSHT